MGPAVGGGAVVPPRMSWNDTMLLPIQRKLQIGVRWGSKGRRVRGGSHARRPAPSIGASATGSSSPSRTACALPGREHHPQSQGHSARRQPITASAASSPARALGCSTGAHKEIHEKATEAFMLLVSKPSDSTLDAQAAACGRRNARGAGEGAPSGMGR